MERAFLFAWALPLLVVSCGGVRTIRPKDSKKGGRFTEDDGLAAGQYAGVKKESDDVAVGMAPEDGGFLPMHVKEGTMVKGMALPGDDRIVWADMDPDAEVKLGKEFKGRPKRESVWHASFQEATRESMRTGKPLLIWFTKTGSPASPMCARLKREVFAESDFGKWAKDKLVRLKVDAAGGDRSIDEFGQVASSQMAKRKYALKLKKQFHVMGHPTLVLVQPDGAVYLQERGFSRGGKKELWGKLKNGVLTIEHNREVWERKMALKGYRRWEGKNGEEVFAKLRRYSKGYLLLTEPDGNVIKTSQKYLSNDDRGWIVAEKKKRGL